ncbi:hypothetical protein EUGRSUZ_G00355 [Eucalyptus grandis]|uniref:Uncharacterized protein n=2 Tax=Eucalyptus grandis TaxID=71139 RepID=A0ACC3K103_EUCGR|nr:hypothetical protein EUGRSUZ_G00355 [Eucalyptus grandis]
MEVAMSRTKEASRLWFAGFADACCLHRVVALCLRSKKLSIRTGQCFLLNGFIFLGSIVLLKSLVIPTLEWILPENCSQITSQDSCPFSRVLRLYSFLRSALVQLFYVFWFYPLYIFSIILSTMWYNDIAKHGFAAMEEQPSNQNEAVALESTTEKENLVDLGGYKWNFTEVSLDKRLDFFQSNWAFFAGFGNPCVLASFFFSPLVGYGVMAILFPLFVLTATSSRAEQAIFSKGRKEKDAGLGRLPLFYAADTFSMWVLRLLNLESWEQVQEKKMH